MPKNWKTYKLGDLIEVKNGYAFKGEFFQMSQQVLQVDEKSYTKKWIEMSKLWSEKEAENTFRF